MRGFRFAVIVVGLGRLGRGGYGSVAVLGPIFGVVAIRVIVVAVRRAHTPVVPT
jgi:hypothetical protein